MYLKYQISAVKCPQWLIYWYICILLHSNVNFLGLLDYFASLGLNQLSRFIKTCFTNLNTWKVNVTAGWRMRRRPHLCLSQVWNLNKCFMCKHHELWMRDKQLVHLVDVLCSLDATRRKILSWQHCAEVSSYLTVKRVCVWEEARTQLMSWLSTAWGGMICGCKIHDGPAAVSLVM